MLIFIPAGGLANRLRSICSAIQLSKDCGIPLKIIWFKDQGLGCRFSDLFNPIQEEGIVLREATWADKLLLDRPRRKNFYLPRIYQRWAFTERLYEQQITPLRNSNFDFRGWATAQSAYMASYTLFYQFPGEMLRTCFVPVPEIQEELERELKDVNGDTIGIHIRRTDHTIAILESPTELFFRKMDEQIERDPATRFYLATDSQEEKRDFMERYGERIRTIRQEADRTNREGMRDAVKEFFLLSACKEIWGSSDSSFSEMAAYRSDIPLKVIRKKINS
ncbi:MAG: glycosyl transferase [Bacteroides sp.]|nr:glycosyl transferase [Bacteroides sp.]